MVETPNTAAGAPGEDELTGRLLGLVRDFARELNPQREQSPPIGLDSRFDRDLGFDSLVLGELLLHIEHAFEVRLGAELLAEVETPSDFLAALGEVRSGALVGADREERPAAGDAEPEDALVCRQLPHEGQALGVAVRLLHTHEPFSSYTFGTFAKTLTGQIQRRHYVFSIKGTKIVGYIGWALCQTEVAEAWMARRAMPTAEECRDGPCWVGLAWCAEDHDVVACQASYLRELYPDKKIYGARDLGGGTTRAVRLADLGLPSDGDEEGLS
jgi:acyl carrier protein/hemolysin-activating ACP:hemolysin acyltransferase